MRRRFGLLVCVGAVLLPAAAAGQSGDRPDNGGLYGLLGEDAPAWTRAIRNVQISASELPGSGDDLGVTELRAGGSLILPAPMLERSFFVLNPRFGVRLLDGPASADVPPTLYSFATTIGWRYQHSPDWSVMLAVSPGLQSDLEAFGGRAFRLMALATASYRHSDRWRFNFGVVFPDRADVPVLPAFGAVWTPNEDWRVEMTLPNPTVKRRVGWLGGGAEDWLYAGVRFGGGTWAVRRDDGSDDEVTLRDFRLVGGLERKNFHGMNLRFEAGFVFGRRVSFGGATPAVEPGNGAFVRFGWGF